MKILVYIFWILIGSGLAFGFLYSQSWSTRIIHPDRAKFSKWLIVGGAVIRWLIIFLVLFLSLTSSIIALLITFGSFMAARLIILFIWDKQMLAKTKNTT